MQFFVGDRRGTKEFVFLCNENCEQPGHVFIGAERGERCRPASVCAIECGVAVTIEFVLSQSSGEPYRYHVFFRQKQVRKRTIWSTICNYFFVSCL
jgi:hypothetical protein